MLDLYAKRLIEKGMDINSAIFLSGFKTAIHCLVDIEKKGVPPEYVEISSELGITLDKLESKYSETKGL